ncbi:MAG: hypothetical protein JWN46_2693 [Acidimicrobiales bacterium]|nr:hypothetical protein [Acidimicrobiales bacterium]
MSPICRPLVAVLVACTLLLAPACSKATRDKAKDTLKSAQQDAQVALDKAAPRVEAEALRAALKVDPTARSQGVRSVKALRDAATKVPGHPQITGIVDANGDGKDDDGKVQVNAKGYAACLILPATGTDTTVKSGPC